MIVTSTLKVSVLGLNSEREGREKGREREKRQRKRGRDREDGRLSSERDYLTSV